MYELLSYTHIIYTWQHFKLLGVYSVLASGIALLTFRVYDNVIRHSTLREAWRIIATASLKALLIVMLCRIFLSEINFKLIGLSDFFVTVVVLFTVRILISNIYNTLRLSTFRKRKYILVYGTGDDSVALVASGASDLFMPDYRVQGFITTDSKKKKFHIAGYPVYQVENVEKLKKLATQHDIDGILFPYIQIARKEKEQLIRYCENINLRILTIPDLEEMKNGRIHRTVRRVKIEDLLGREEIRINLKETGNLLEGKTVLVTGAAGSIGSEICRQLAGFHIRQLICFDMGETPMHTLRLELEEKFPSLHFVPIIGNVCNEARINFVFNTYHPEIVFHAAAYKHVPLMEENPCEAIRVNVYGTKVIADYAVRCGVEKFVMVSTDKAVNPTSIMGCSKRIAEIYVQSLNKAIVRDNMKGNTKFVTTRFGNVLGSNGSVIPRFRDQIKNGGPVTVTHPDIIRFFMTIPEACRLVLEAGTMGNGGEIFVFEMGTPVKIADLARRMIELSGLKPNEDISIVYTGLRPGEKLYEELLSNGELTRKTPHEKIRVASVREYEYDAVVPRIELLVNFSYEVNIPEMVKEMKTLVPEYKSQNSEFQKYDRT
jgi:FlaA1/EpsC-like NDP-sugar epimerase